MIVMGTNKILQISPVNQNMSPMNSKEVGDDDSSNTCNLFGSGALSGKLLLVRIIENNKIDD